jgi:hypothetical protein
LVKNLITETRDDLIETLAASLNDLSSQLVKVQDLRATSGKVLCGERLSRAYSPGERDK